MNLKAARVNQNLTQKQAAEKLGITVDMLSNYERGLSYPKAPVIQKMLEVYKVSFDQLVFLPKSTV